MDIWPSIVLIFMLIFVNAFFAMSEIAIISINSQKMKRLAEGGNKAAEAAAGHYRFSFRFSCDNSGWRNLSGFSELCCSSG